MDHLTKSELRKQIADYQNETQALRLAATAIMHGLVTWDVVGERAKIQSGISEFFRVKIVRMKIFDTNSWYVTKAEKF